MNPFQFRRISVGSFVLGTVAFLVLLSMCFLPLNVFPRLPLPNRRTTNTISESVNLSGALLEHGVSDLANFPEPISTVTTLPDHGHPHPFAVVDLLQDFTDLALLTTHMKRRKLLDHGRIGLHLHLLNVFGQQFHSTLDEYTTRAIRSIYHILSSHIFMGLPEASRLHSPFPLDISSSEALWFTNGDCSRANFRNTLSRDLTTLSLLHTSLEPHNHAVTELLTFLFQHIDGLEKSLMKDMPDHRTNQWPIARGWTFIRQFLFNINRRTDGELHTGLHDIIRRLHRSLYEVRDHLAYLQTRVDYLGKEKLDVLRKYAYPPAHKYVCADFYPPIKHDIVTLADGYVRFHEELVALQGPAL